MSDIGGKLKDTSQAVTDAAEKKVASARSGVMTALDQANQTVRSAADRGTEMGAEMFESGRRAAEQVRESTANTTASITEAFGAVIERQPFTAVAVAAAMGFLAGMMLRRG
jgi:ElaB/YqjD/DUF883 family membrane-anchored ribosome-binding protein